MIKPEDFNLLIVDDEIGIQEVLSAHFEFDGYKVLTASGGFEALEIIKKNPIDFIISDIRMPDGDGEMLLTKIYEMDQVAPSIVLVSGFSNLTKEEALKKGAIDLLPKPIDLDLIEKYIQTALTKPI